MGEDTRLFQDRATMGLPIFDDTAPDVAARSPVQHFVEIIALILAFLAVAIPSEPLAMPIRQEIPETISANVLIALHVRLAYKASRFVARWVSQ